MPSGATGIGGAVVATESDLEPSQGAAARRPPRGVLRPGAPGGGSPACGWPSTVPAASRVSPEVVVEGSSATRGSCCMSSMTSRMTPRRPAETAPNRCGPERSITARRFPWRSSPRHGRQPGLSPLSPASSPSAGCSGCGVRPLPPPSPASSPSAGCSGCGVRCGFAHGCSLLGSRFRRTCARSPGRRTPGHPTATASGVPGSAASTASASGRAPRAPDPVVDSAAAVTAHRTASGSGRPAASA